MWKKNIVGCSRVHIRHSQLAIAVLSRITALLLMVTLLGAKTTCVRPFSRLTRHENSKCGNVTGVIFGYTCMLIWKCDVFWAATKEWRKYSKERFRRGTACTSLSRATTVCELNKVVPSKLFSIFLLRLRQIYLPFAGLPIYIHTYLSVLLDLSHIY